MRLFALLLVLCSIPLSAQIAFKVDNESPLSITPQQLAQLPRHTVNLNDHGKQVSFEGVLLSDVLQKNGVDLSKPLRGPRLSTYVAAIGTDGYEVVYSLAEFDPTLADAGILLADKREGSSLKPDEGPYRLIVPHDKRPARSLKMLKEIDVVQLKH